MRRILFVLPVIVCLLMLYAGSAHAYGTASGTVIGNFATMTATNVPSATQSNTFNTSVTAVFGATTTIRSADASGGVGAFVDYGFEVRNPGNDSQSIAINVGAQDRSGVEPLTEWSVQIDDAAAFGSALVNWQNNPGKATATQGGDQATGVANMPIGPDALASYTVRVQISPNAVDSATHDLVVKFVSDKVPYGLYTGYNSNDYGADWEAYREAGGGQGVTYLTTTVQGPVLMLAKSVVTIDSNLAGYTGGLTDPVPGAKIKYRVEFSNTGTVNATVVEMSDVLPANTEFVVGTIESCFGGPACGVVPDGDANIGGDDCWYVATRVGCDMDPMAFGGGGGAVEYEVTIN